MTWLLRRIKRQHNACWVSLVWMEPFGASTWCVWVHPSVGSELEIARASSRWMALWKAYRCSWTFAPWVAP